jgi:transposase InsO family protein
MRLLSQRHACEIGSLHLKGANEIAERRAFAIRGAHRSNEHYRSRCPDDSEIRARVRKLAARPRRSGYRRFHLLLAREDCHMNQKRLRRLYQEESFQVRKRDGPNRVH